MISAPPVHPHQAAFEPFQCQDRVVASSQERADLIQKFYNLSASWDAERGHEIYDYTEGTDIRTAYDEVRFALPV